MATKVKDGGPAFPSTTEFDDGISKRDWFAGMALQSLAKVDSDNGRFRDEATAQRTADYAYRLADAMLAEREKGK